MIFLLLIAMCAFFFWLGHAWERDRHDRAWWESKHYNVIDPYHPEHREGERDRG